MTPRSRRRPRQPLRVFLSFSHTDSPAKDLLCKHLSSLAQDGLVRLWGDRQLPPGEWPQAIAGQLKRAEVVLLLVSCDFISSPHCNAEARCALERHQAGSCLSIPIILRDCDWTTRPWAQLVCLPTDGHPVMGGKWHSPDEAFADVARRLRDWLAQPDSRFHRYKRLSASSGVVVSTESSFSSPKSRRCASDTGGPESPKNSPSCPSVDRFASFDLDSRGLPASSSSPDSRLSRISRARATTSGGSPARRATSMP
jgi:TIR domain